MAYVFTADLPSVLLLVELRRNVVATSPRPTTTSLLIVRKEQTGGAPGAEAIPPMASRKGVEAGAAQSYVS